MDGMDGMTEKQKQDLILKLCKVGMAKSKVLENMPKTGINNLAEANNLNGFVDAIMFCVQEIEKIK